MARFPLWSADSKHILFNARRERRTDWWVASVEERAPVNTGAVSVLRMQGFSRNLDPGAWLDDGVLFAGRFRDAVSLWQAPVTNTFQCSGSARQVADVAISRVAAARNGALVVAAVTSRQRVWSLDKNGKLEPVATETAPGDRVARALLEPGLD